MPPAPSSLSDAPVGGGVDRSFGGVPDGLRRRSSQDRISREASFRLAGVGLVALTIVSRLPFMTRTLYAFDSANYALAVRDFYNVAFHQPHPPGYPLYVFFARIIDLASHDPNRALVVEGIAWSALAVACTIAVGRAMFGRAFALLAGLLLVCTVGFWGYGEVAYPYVALAGETAGLALLAHTIRSGHARAALALGAAWAISLGTRWDGAVFCVPLAIWALWQVSWRLRLSSIAIAALVVFAWAVPMVQLSGGWDTYRQALAAYLQVWSPQSAYVGVVGDYASGGETQATYNLNFLINYLRQMLGVGLLLVLYLLGRRFGPARLAADYRSRFLALWVVPPLLVYVFAHLGEPGYVLSLAPAASVLAALAIFDLRDEVTQAVAVMRARWRRLPSPRSVGWATAAALSVAIIGWNVQAFARGVGPGRLPDLRAHDATTTAQLDFIRQQPAANTFILAHDIFRQLKFYVPTYGADLLFSEYVPNFETARSTTLLPPQITQVVVLDSPLRVPADDASRVREVILLEQPRVAVWLVNTESVRTIEHGYRFLRTVRD